MCLLQLALLTHSHSYYAVKAFSVVLSKLGVIVVPIRLLLLSKPFNCVQGYLYYRFKTISHADARLLIKRSSDVLEPVNLFV